MCSSEQIDINSASLKELEKLDGIGPTIAQRIIEARPFEDVDDLTKVSGIASKKLNSIKEQGLACVDKEKEVEDKIEKDVEADKEEIKVYPDKIDTEPKNLDLKPIILESKSIKSEENNENLKKSLAIMGIVTFCGVFGALFFFKMRKRKNDFQ